MIMTMKNMRLFGATARSEQTPAKIDLNGFVRFLNGF